MIVLPQELRGRIRGLQTHQRKEESAVPGIRTAIEGKLVIAVSPIIGGETIKGPAAKMYTELEIKPSALAVAIHYADLITGFVFDQVDVDLKDEINLPVLITDTIMYSLKDRQRLAEEIIFWVKEEMKTLEDNAK